MFADDYAVFLHIFREKRQNLQQRIVPVGRIEKGNIELFMIALQKADGIRAENYGDVGEPARLDILLDAADRTRVAVDERRMTGAAAQRFDAHLSAAGEQIEHLGAGKIKLQGGTDGLLDLVGCRAGVHALGCDEASAPCGSGNDAHCSVLLSAGSARTVFSPVYCGQPEYSEMTRIRPMIC